MTVGEFAAAANVETGAEHSDGVAQRLRTWLRPALADGPVYWLLGNRAEDSRVFGHLQLGFPWHRVVSTAPNRTQFDARLKSTIEAMVRHCRRHTVTGRCAPDSPIATHVADRASVLGARLMQMGHPLAGPLLTQAANWSPGVAKVLNNLAANLLHRGLAKEAYDLCERVQEQHPHYRKIQRTAAKAALLSGQPDRGLEHAKRYLPGRATGDSATLWLEELARLAADPDIAQRFRDLRP